jgi:phytanoyl-CoA hydroxylase
MADQLDATQWAQYERDGYVNLGKVLSDADLAAMQRRIDDIMMGTADVPYDRLLMQRDSETGRYADAGPQTKGHKGATLNYRKIEQLELDPLFLAYMQRPLFQHICANGYGAGTSIASYRAMFMNKPANMGTWLPWHQDRWSNLNIDPLITVWTALDPATEANGCVQILSGTHRLGLINPDHPSGFLTTEQADRLISEHRIVKLELAPGESVLLHNWLLHASDVNHTAVPRRAFSVCYMDGRTRTNKGDSFPIVF